jgi:hypothetical protein
MAEDALMEQRMSKGWGGKQPKTHATKWKDSNDVEHVQHVVFQPDDPLPVSKYSGRLKAGEAPPSHVGECQHFGNLNSG